MGTTRARAVLGTTVAAWALGAFGGGTATASAALDFTPQPDLAAPGPRSVTFADVNDDGVADLIFPAQETDRVGVSLGAPGGTFAAPVFFAVGDRPRNVVADDFDGDGKLDLVVSNSSSNFVSVLTGNGDGTFGAAASVAVGANNAWLAVDDVNGDGDPDLVVARYSTNTVAVLLGAAGSTFDAPTSYAAGGNGPSNTTLADVNGDGRRDMVVANELSGSVSVLTRNADGTFAAATTTASGAAPYSVDTADVDGDGDLDLAVGASGANVVSILLNDGAGAFTPGVAVPASSVVAASFADVDADGNVDLAVARGNLVEIRRGDGAGHFATVDASAPTGATAAWTTAADLNDDGSIDLAVANLTANTISILFGKNTADLGLTASADVASLGLNETATYTLTVKNDGPRDATGVNVTAPLPTGTTFVPTGSSAECTEAAGVITCDAGDVTNAATETFTAKVELAATSAPDPALTATIDGAEADTRPGNDTASVNLTIARAALTTTVDGTGAGYVDSSRAGIDCGLADASRTDCSETLVKNEAITLAAHPDSATDFAGFTGGGCSGTGATCTVTLDQAKTVKATFTAKPKPQDPAPQDPAPQQPTPPGPPITPQQPAQPKGRVAVSHRTVKLRKGRVLVSLRCGGAPNASSCAGDVSLKATGKSRRVGKAGTAAAQTFGVNAGARSSLRLLVPAATQKQLKRKKRAVVQIQVTMADGTKLKPVLLTVIR